MQQIYVFYLPLMEGRRKYTPFNEWLLDVEECTNSSKVGLLRMKARYRKDHGPVWLNQTPVRDDSATSMETLKEGTFCVLSDVIAQDIGGCWSLIDKLIPSPLVWACSERNMELLKLFLERIKAPTDVNEALTMAVEKSQIDMIELLIDNGADVKDGQALIKAAEAGDEAVVGLLLDEGANVDAVNDKGDTALIAACEYGNYEAAKLLLSNNANVNIKSYGSYGKTALMYACKNGNYKIVQMLVEEKANTEGGILMARTYGNFDIAEYLDRIMASF